MAKSTISLAELTYVIQMSKRRIKLITNRRRSTLRLEDLKDISGSKDVWTENVINVLINTKMKMKVSLMLPYFLANFPDLYSHLKDTPFQECIELSRKYLRTKANYEDNLEFNPHLIRLVDYFHRNLNIVQYLPLDWDAILDEKDKALLEAFETLIRLSKHHLKISAFEQLETEKTIHKLLVEIKNLQNSIQKNRLQVQRQKICLRWKQAARRAVLEEYKNHLSMVRAKRQMQMEQQVMVDCFKIQKANLESLEQQKQLKTDLENLQVAYEKLLIKNKLTENRARDEKNKYTIQLQTNVAKFDETVVNLIRENMELEEEYKREKQKYDLFLLEYEEKEAEYFILVKEKEILREKEREERLNFLIQNRAARVIQRFWRKYVDRTQANRQTKKGKGKGKGKTKTKGKK